MSVKTLLDPGSKLWANLNTHNNNIDGTVTLSTLSTNKLLYIDSNHDIKTMPDMADGQLIIGTGAGNVPAVANLIAGAAISIINTPGGITINATGGLPPATTDFIPSVDNMYDIGQIMTPLRWRNIFLSNLVETKDITASNLIDTKDLSSSNLIDAKDINTSGLIDSVDIKNSNLIESKDLTLTGALIGTTGLFSGNIVGLNLSGINTGDVTLSAMGGSPNSNGATLSGQVLNLEPANGSFPGLMTAVAQTFSGNKTFNNSISASNLSGTNTGDISLTAIGSSPNANSASLSGQALTLQPANGSFPGIVTTGTQTFGGNKTFSGSISASNLSGTNTGDITLTAIGSSPNANSASLSGQALTLQPADGSFPGIVTTGSQTIAGSKTFNSRPNFIISGGAQTYMKRSANSFGYYFDGSTLGGVGPSADRTVCFQDPGANCYFVLSEGAQTINGNKTFTSTTTMSGQINSTSTTDSSSVSTGAIITSGGVGIAKKLFVGDQINEIGTTDSSSISTGSIVTAGGVGIAKKLYVGDDIRTKNNNAGFADYYEDTYTAVLFGPNTVSATANCVRVGKMVIVDFVSSNAVASATAIYTFTATLGAQYRPSSIRQGICFGVINNVSTTCLFECTTGGILKFYATPGFGTFVTGQINGIPTSQLVWTVL